MQELLMIPPPSTSEPAPGAGWACNKQKPCQVTNEWVCVLDWPSSAPPLPWFHTDHWVLTSLTASLLPHTFKQTEHSMQIQCSAGLMTSHFTLELISSTHGTCDITLYHRPQNLWWLSPIYYCEYNEPHGTCSFYTSSQAAVDFSEFTLE